MQSGIQKEVNMQIDLKVAYHPSGRRTLMKRSQAETMYCDVQEPALFANEDAGEFYKAVAARLAKLQADGHQFTYEDN